MANPYSVAVPNILEALTLGEQGYDGMQKRNAEREMKAGRQEAMQALQGGGDLRGPIAKLLGVGDVKGASVIAEFAKNQAEGQGVFGTPIYGTNPDGSTGIGTFNKQGAFKPIDTGGFRVTPGIKTVDGPTGTTVIDSKTGRPMQGGTMQPGAAPTPNQPAPSFIPKDVAGAARMKTEGTKTAEAAFNLPNALAKADQSIAIVDQLINHKGRETATGVSGAIDPRNYVPATDARNFQIALKQLEGQAFLQAFESLKGGGAITEVEGQKATQAIARLDRAQSDSEFKNALTELRGILVAGKQRAQQIAQQPQQSAQPAAQPSGLPAAPRVGEARDGYRYKGGDPADPSSWVQMK
jgi:hypothetical protein